MKYNFRAECKHDADLIKKTLQIHILNWKEEDVYLDTNPPSKIPDLEVEFETIDDSINLDQIREIISNLIDCHIASQTLDLKDCYTGKRKY